MDVWLLTFWSSVVPWYLQGSN